MPESGKSGIVAAKTKSSTIPVQNTGADQQASDSAVTRPLTGPRGLRAACTPRTEPRVAAMRSAVAVSRIVGPRRARIRSVTGASK